MIINADLVDCIVAMPTQLFYTTQIPVSLWFLAKNKKQKGKTLFIDARKLRELTDEDIKKIAGIEWELKDGVLTIRGEGALRETPWSENVDCIQKVIIAAVGDSNSLFTRYHKLPGILCFVTSVCRCPRSWHSITWSATLMSCCVLQFLM